MALAYQFDEPSARRIGKVVRRIEAEINGAVDEPLKARFDDGWRAFKNDSGETIPKWGLFRVHDVSVVSLDAYARVAKKPDTTFSQLYAVNSSMAVGDGELGLCRLFGDVLVVYDSGTPAFGEGWGPKPAQFTASKFYPACLIVEKVLDSTQKIMLAQLGPIQRGIGKANGSTSNRTSGAISIWAGTFGSEVDITGMDPTAFNLGTDVSTDDWVNWDHLDGQMVFMKLCS